MKKQWFSKLGNFILAAILLLSVAITQIPSANAAGDTDSSTVSDADLAAAAGRTLIRWSIGIGTGADAAQIPIEASVVADFNASQDDIYLVMEIIPNEYAKDVLAYEMAAGNAPDIIGPVGWVGANNLHGQWLDIAPYIASTGYDTSKFEAAMLQQFQTDEGTVGLPFAVYPSAIYYNKALFTAAGLNPLPVTYGTQYMMPGGSMVAWNWTSLAQVAKLLTLDNTGKHSGQAGFNPANIVQYGFSFGWEGHPNYWGTFMSKGGQLLHGSSGSYSAVIPPAWKTAWQWVYDGIWGAEPFIPNGAAEGNLAGGNVFASGKVGMLVNPSWYLCCIGDLVSAGGQFEFGTLPVGLNGGVAGRVDADSFRIWKGTAHPAQAFTVLTYLIDTGIQKLVVGSPGNPPAYGALPAITSLRGPWLAQEQAAFPFVQHWNTLLAGMNYPDVPSAEAFMPNMTNSWTRLSTFAGEFMNTGFINLAAQETLLEADLTTIFNQASPPLTRTLVRWSMGLGTGSDPGQLPIEFEVAKDYNNSQTSVFLAPESIQNLTSRADLAAEIAAGVPPDIVGPVGWAGSHSLHGMLLDLAPYISSTHFDTSIFNPELYNMYHTDEGQVGLPFAVYPSAIFYNPALFDAAGVHYPPAHYGDKYVMPDNTQVTWSWQTVAQVSKLLTLDNTGKNSTQAGFDPNNIVQYGFTFGWENKPNYWGSYWKAGQILQGTPGAYSAVIPSAWREAWQWVHTGIYGAQPYIPNNPGDNAVFSSSHVAMLENPIWYLCCIGDLPGAGGTFQFGAMPSYNGVVAGRVDADSFRILNTTLHPNQAFNALAYLVTTGVDKLIVGSSGTAPAYGAVPAITSKQEPFWDAKAVQFPFVTTASWNIMKAGLNYPDVPSAEAWMPNFDDAWSRLQTFGDLLQYSGPINLNNEIFCLQLDLRAIFNGVSLPTSCIPSNTSLPLVIR